MAQFNGMTLTKTGREVLAKVLTGEQLLFTRVSSGDGTLPEGQDIYDMTELVHPVKDMPIASIKKTGVGTATLLAILSNENLESGYFIRELGLFARDPDTSEEILYGYCNAADRADYMPGSNGPDLVQYALTLVTVIDQAQNVTAVISEGLVWATHEEVEYRIDSIFAKVAAIDYFWTKSAGDGNLLRPSTLDQVKQAILGVTDIESLNRRVERLEDAVAQILLELEVREIYPDYSHWILEDFRVVNQVDLYMCKVTSVVAGDDSLDCEPVVGLIPGSFYTITDGISHELVQAKHVAAENGIQRLILAAPVQNTYRLDTTYLYRTSATIGDGYAMGPTGKKNISWSTGVWKGQAAEEEYLIPLETTVGNSGSLEISGDIQITADGFLTLGGE